MKWIWKGGVLAAIVRWLFHLRQNKKDDGTVGQ